MSNYQTKRQDSNRLCRALGRGTSVLTAGVSPKGYVIVFCKSFPFYIGASHRLEKMAAILKVRTFPDESHNRNGIVIQMKKFFFGTKQALFQASVLDLCHYLLRVEGVEKVHSPLPLSAENLMCLLWTLVFDERATAASFFVCSKQAFEGEESKMADPAKERALAEYRKKIMEHREIEATLKACKRFSDSKLVLR